MGVTLCWSWYPVWGQWELKGKHPAWGTLIWSHSQSCARCHGALPPPPPPTKKKRGAPRPIINIMGMCQTKGTPTSRISMLASFIPTPKWYPQKRTHPYPTGGCPPPFCHDFALPSFTPHSKYILFLHVWVSQNRGTQIGQVSSWLPLKTGFPQDRQTQKVSGAWPSAFAPIPPPARLDGLFGSAT